MTKRPKVEEICAPEVSLLVLKARKTAMPIAVVAVEERVLAATVAAMLEARRSEQWTESDV
jgi:hypothetical protein